MIVEELNDSTQTVVVFNAHTMLAVFKFGIHAHYALFS